MAGEQQLAGRSVNAKSKLYNKIKTKISGKAMNKTTQQERKERNQSQRKGNKTSPLSVAFWQY